MLQKTVSRTPLAGQLLNQAAQAVADVKYAKLRPRFSFKRQEVKPGEFQVRGSVLSWAHGAEQGIRTEMTSILNGHAPGVHAASGVCATPSCGAPWSSGSHPHYWALGSRVLPSPSPRMLPACCLPPLPLPFPAVLAGCRWWS